MRPLLVVSVLVSLAAGFAPAFSPAALSQSVASSRMEVAVASCRRNTKKEKRLRNLEYARQFRRAGANGAKPGTGKKKPLSRKKIAMKAQSAKEKEREAFFVTKLYTEIEPPTDADKIDLGLI